MFTSANKLEMMFLHQRIYEHNIIICLFSVQYAQNDYYCVWQFKNELKGFSYYTNATLHEKTRNSVGDMFLRTGHTKSLVYAKPIQSVEILGK